MPTGWSLRYTWQFGGGYMDDREFWIMIRSAILLVLDAIERKLGISPRSSELRAVIKAERLG